MFDCILVSLDGTRASEAVLPLVEKLLQAFPGKVVLLRVGPAVNLDLAAHEMMPDIERAYELPPEDFELLNTASELEIRRYLEGIAHRLQQTGATTEIEVSFNKPVDEILFMAKEHKADVIVMATHARSGLDRWLHGSVTESVIHQMPCPVLVVKAPNTPLPPFAPWRKHEPVRD